MQSNLFEEILSQGMEERLRKERLFFIRDVKSKLLQLLEAATDSKTLAKELTDYLNSFELTLTCSRY